MFSSRSYTVRRAPVSMAQILLTYAWAAPTAVLVGLAIWSASQHH